MTAGSQRALQLTLAMCADDREPDRESRVAAAEHDVGQRGDVEKLRGEPADGERTRGGAERRAPPGEPRALRGHRRAPLLIELGR